MQNTEGYLAQLNIGESFRGTLRRSFLILALLVILAVFWSLKLTGITMAGDAFCGHTEHIHGESCDLRELICPDEEIAPHSHDWTCNPKTLICTLPETEGHAHDELCGSAEEGYVCGLVEVQEHIHDENCYDFEDGDYICGLEETEGHLHGESCYRELEYCPLEEHIHQADCYSDFSADLETSEIWEQTLPEWNSANSLAENIVLIAQSQLGVQESVRNFKVDENDIRRGITRYGQWYGNPYGDWSAMFAGFCLHYAGVEEFPINAGPETMRLEWEAAELYVRAANYLPAVGNLLFLDRDENGTADAVAIITDVENEQIFAIEGDVQDAVAEVTYAMSDSVVLGYGRVLEEQLFQPSEGTKLIAQIEKISEELFADGNNLVIYCADESSYYAIDGNGEWAEIIIDRDGMVYTEAEVPELLLWTVKNMNEDGGYVFQNLVTNMYLPEQMPVSVYSLDAADAEENTDGNYQYARAVDYTVWLDGTLGNMMSYRDSDNTRYTVTGGSKFMLPTEWKSPGKYAYVLQGWYDVVNNKYYAPGESVVVDKNLVFYADWVAASYDIGVYNSSVYNTLKLDNFITTHVFDYSILFNVLSSRASVTFNNNSHSETWSLLTSGNNSYNGQRTLNYIFRDWDAQNSISYPQNTNNQNTYTGEGIYFGLYNENLRSLLFDTDNAFDPVTKTGVIGKTYLGTGDYLFQLVTDPNDEHYGYYFYNSEQHAASYNQSDQRFYVYDYLVRTSESANSSGDGVGKYSDFLPLNSPYANTNGKQIPTYTYQGIDNEYVGTTHYAFDGKYNDNGSSPNNVGANFWFGMMIDVKFYLPSVPGERDANGNYGNQDIYGKDMHFQFSGDDDVWVLVDGKVVLDIGGIHGVEGGDINFATGVVTTYNSGGNTTSTLSDIGAGDHTLTICYLERGASQSNCKMYFNLAPRFSFSIQKEDVLTRDILNGAQFSVYDDEACTIPSELWTSEASYERGDPSTNVFTVTDGVATMWGMGAGHSYYIKETKPPDQQDYTYPYGIIRLTIDKKGTASYSVQLMDEATKAISPGFTVHGFRIDEETQEAYIVATNAPVWVTETTSITAVKRWNDNENHSGDTITVYLTITDPDGTVRRLQEAKLGGDNNWQYTWENMPKYYEDGETLIQYGVEEAYIPGYSYTVERITETTSATTEWTQTTDLQNGKTYIFGYNGQYLSTLSTGSDVAFKWVSESEAKSSKLALWTVKTSGNKVMLTNGENQTLSFWYGNGSPTDFFAATSQSEDNNTKRYFAVYKDAGSGTVRLYYDASTDYYLSPNTVSSTNSKFQYTTNRNSGMALTPWTLTETTTTVPIDGLAYRITNTKLTKETSLTVNKVWDYGNANNNNSHEKSQVTVKLLANGQDTGRTVTLSLQNGWTDTFRGLPYQDGNGNVIAYSVEEIWHSDEWVAFYGEVRASAGNIPTYSTTIVNRNRLGMGGPELPSTGSMARMLYVLCGGAIMLASLVYGFGTRRKRERRMK